MESGSDEKAADRPHPSSLAATNIRSDLSGSSSSSSSSSSLAGHELPPSQLPVLTSQPSKSSLKKFSAGRVGSAGKQEQTSSIPPSTVSHLLISSPPTFDDHASCRPF